MKLSVLAILITLWVGGLASPWGSNDHHRCHHHGDDDDDHHHCNHTGYATPVTGGTFNGTPFPPSQRADEPDDDEPPPSIPTEPARGPIAPSGPAINVNIMGGNGTNNSIPRVKRQSCSGSSIVFDTSTVYSSNTESGVNGSPKEPSGAKAGNVVFATSNWNATISLDGGATFNDIDPTVYTGPSVPATDAGFCCDQVVQYLPSIDRFVWLLQYQQNTANINRLRLITFHPKDVDTKGINSYIYMDIDSTSFGGRLDYGELGVGNTQLYLSTTVYAASGNGLVVFRIPIEALDVVGSLTYYQTSVSDGFFAQGSRLTQNPGDTVFWAGQSTLGSVIRVFRWPESSIIYQGIDLTISPWPYTLSNFVSNCPNSKTNWLFANSANNIIGATRRSTNEVWFAWNAPSGGDFPNPHIQIVQVNVGNWPNPSKIRQWQIWNPDFAFAFPNFYTSSECGDVGVAVLFGGSSTNPSSAVGVITSDGVLTQTVYYPELSNTCEFRLGDYLGVRSENGVAYEGFIYAIESSDGIVTRSPRYVEFGRG